MSTAGSTGGAASTGAASTGAASTGAASTGAAASRWNDNWRDLLAAGTTDAAKELTQLQRYESPEAIWKKARELERRMSSGELRSTLPANATAQEVAAWRQQNGLPDKPEGYKINMPGGKEAPKEDDKFLKAFLKSAHDAHFTQAQVDAGLKLFYEQVDAQESAFKAAEDGLAQKADDKLHELWGRDYRVNKQAVENLLARAPKGFRDRFLNGYLDDHTPIRASVEAWQWLVSLEREMNPASTVLPNLTGDPAKGVAGRIAELKAMMGNPTSAYWKGAQAEAMQQEYRELIAAQQKMAERQGEAA